MRDDPAHGEILEALRDAPGAWLPEALASIASAVFALGGREASREDLLRSWHLAPRTLSAEDAEAAAESRAETARNNLMLALRAWHKTEPPKTDGN